MGDASGMYASPTGTGPQNGGAGQRQGNEQGLHNESFSLEVGEQSSGQGSGPSRVVDANGVAQFEPRNKKEAFRFEAWRKSMQDEYDSLILNGVWVLILLSHVLATGAKIISGKWVWKNKLGELGQVLKNKSRWVARGFTQIYGLNYTDTFAPTPSQTVIKILLAA